MTNLEQPIQEEPIVATQDTKTSKDDWKPDYITTEEVMWDQTPWLSTLQIEPKIEIRWRNTALLLMWA